MEKHNHNGGYSDYIINREISWLNFNERVLQEAIDPTTPLIERIKFLGIFSNNRDEFFRIRVGSLNRLAKFGNKSFDTKEDPRKILSEIKLIVEDQEKIFTQTYSKIVKELTGHGVFIINEKELDQEQGKFIKKFYQETLRQNLFPIILQNFQKMTSIKDGSIYLAVVLQSSTHLLKDNYALIKVPQKAMSRFVILPEKGKNHYIMLLDDAIRYCLEDIFSIFGYDTFNAYTIKITRDAELDLDDDVSKSFLEKLHDSLKQRKSGIPVRFVYDAGIPPKLLNKLTNKLKISDEDNVRGGGRYHNFKDFISFPEIGNKKLYYPAFPPLRHKDIPPNTSIIKILKKKDIILHFPYQSFQYIIDFLREASIDPLVTEVKMTFYRAARYSNVINALVNAARNGKKVTVFLEIQARFDEEANITLAGKLHDEGVKIVPTISGFKVHCKLISITRRENDNEVFYANISSGNYNESTAKVYADDSLLTSNQDIAVEVDKVFKLFETRYIHPEFKTLVVSPFETRKFFIGMLDTEIKNAREGKDAWAIIKMNSLVDKPMVNKLFEASQAGVKLKLIIRGINVLVPGVEGISENIEVLSIVDRFLEHSRIFVFCNGNDPKYYIGSSDWMPRNLDHRVEVLTPVYDPEIKTELWDMIQIYLSDNCKARISERDSINRYKTNKKNKKIRAQFEIYNYFKRKLENN